MQYSKPEVLYVEREKPFIERDDFSNVEQVGYQDIGTQVRNLIIAGENLKAFKRLAYEFPDGEFDEDSVRPDPTLDVGFDLADATYYQRVLARKIKLVKEKEAVEKDSSVSTEKKPVDVVNDKVTSVAT